MSGKGKGEQAYRDGLEALKVLEQAGFAARFAGGSVRDRLLKRKPKDYDIATDALPPQVCSIFRQKGVKVIPTGLDHGTVTVIIRHSPMEVTTLRRDVETDGRHATVAFGSSFEEDAERRDFTINAMFEDRHGKIFDYFGGQADLASQRLRFVGDARTRIQEDYLRILRLFRFWSRLGFTPDEATLSTVSELATGLQQISQERITNEILEILTGEAVLAALLAMQSCSIFEQILPEIQVLPREKLVAITKTTIPATEKAICLFACLLLASPKQIDLDNFTQKWRLSKRQGEKIAILLSPSWLFPASDLNDGELMEWIDQWEAKSEKDYATDVLFPAWLAMFPEHEAMVVRLNQLEEQFGARRRQAIPLTGKALSKILSPGPAMGVMMKRLRIAFRNGEWQTPEEGLELCRKWLS